jgi:ABC-2 type transport system permease protein
MITDTLTLTRRELDRWVRQPTPVLVTLLFPVLIVLMFGFLFGGAITVPGGGGYREFLMPGMFAMAMLFGIETTMTAVATDAAHGITDRFRSLPMSSAAVVAGRGVADLLNSAVGLAVLLACGLLVGWQARNGIGPALAAVGLLLLLRLAVLWAGIYLGLVVPGPEAVVAVQILVWPFTFLSNALVDPSTMPAWLGFLAEWNPLSATVTATRRLFGNPGWEGGGWATDHAILLAIAWPLLLTAVFLPLAVRRWRNLGT